MLGLDVTQISLDKDRIYRNLDVGNPIIVVVGPGDFTTDGHFLVLTGHSGDKITLNDPNSPTNSAKSWAAAAGDVELVLLGKPAHPERVFRRVAGEIDRRHRQARRSAAGKADDALVVFAVAPALVPLQQQRHGL